MWKMINPVMDYSWGSLTTIPDFLGQRASGEPVAELWMGAHPKAPSNLVGFDGDEVPLNEAIASNPAILGPEVRRRFGDHLPFLVKLLAAAKPLSLQVHPSQALAREGYERENAAHLGLGDPGRTYKDDQHKPEAMLALAETETMVGFRPLEEITELLGRLELDWSRRIISTLDEGLTPAFEALLDKDSWELAGEEVLTACKVWVETDRAYALVRELDDHFPGDSGVISPLMLNIVQYGPGQALFVPTGQLHAHISGFGVEVMAASDNVIRAGLTQKYVDQAALLQTMDPYSAKPVLESLASGKYRTEAEEFEVTILIPGQSAMGEGPRILLAVTDALVADIELRRGESVFLAHGEAPMINSGEVWAVSVRSS